MEIATRYLKRLGAWVTDLTDRYQFNPFVKATVNIIAIQILLAILLITVTGWAIQYEQTSTVGSIRTHIQQTHDPQSVVGPTLPQSIQTVRNRTLTYVFIGLVVLIALFGYLLIRFALSPARNSLQFQKRFIGNIAHEIRTPLAIIKTSTEVSLMDPNVSREMRETLNETIVELDRISETINNLLSFDALIRPERMKTERIDLTTIADIVVNRHKALAESRGLSLRLIKNSNPCEILGNSVAIEEVITNLVKNAITYTPANSGGMVTVEVGSEFADHAYVLVSDTGIGIAQKDLMHIFEPFYRGDTSRARNIGTGTSGLGLAIVNEIARLHKGSTSVRSAPGEGTTFKVSFPCAPKARHTHTAQEDADLAIEEVSLDFS